MTKQKKGSRQGNKRKRDGNRNQRSQQQEGGFSYYAPPLHSNDAADDSQDDNKKPRLSLIPNSEVMKQQARGQRFGTGPAASAFPSVPSPHQGDRRRIFYDSPRKRIVTTEDDLRAQLSHRPGMRRGGSNEGVSEAVDGAGERYGHMDMLPGQQPSPLVNKDGVLRHMGISERGRDRPAAAWAASSQSRRGSHEWPSQDTPRGASPAQTTAEPAAPPPPAEAASLDEQPAAAREADQPDHVAAQPSQASDEDAGGEEEQETMQDDATAEEAEEDEQDGPQAADEAAAEASADEHGAPSGAAEEGMDGQTDGNDGPLDRDTATGEPPRQHQQAMQNGDSPVGKADDGSRVPAGPPDVNGVHHVTDAPRQGPSGDSPTSLPRPPILEHRAPSADKGMAEGDTSPASQRDGVLLSVRTSVRAPEGAVATVPVVMEFQALKGQKIVRQSPGMTLEALIERYLRPRVTTQPIRVFLAQSHPHVEEALYFRLGDLPRVRVDELGGEWGIRLKFEIDPWYT
ncbi:unnamed protein product [Vitrella brassicaformis CCMP3155]|uniref:Uncharacterized protein n=1 Tax=Vitrella brassicaformis (strain CCMP3155) TaxID=1169540 RepID=A0A0G4FSS0_VITBC|nr:unnamed protein product [Vitrella brassicaformis CCMP3155]|eukprot:CEM17337.1 unnamed protein product [Vitrella brassicaformis CCMP3155]